MMTQQIETIYGHGILENELSTIDRFVVVTDEIPWQLHHSAFGDKPVKVVMPETLEKEILDNEISGIPYNVEFIGLGGGKTLDAAKYFALIRQKTPILVPTITSTNGPFSDFISITNGEGVRFGFKKMGWPKRVLVDYNLILKADPRFNRAGYGDLLMMQTTLNDWQLAASLGKTHPLDPELENIIHEMMNQSLDSASLIGSMNSEGIKLLMELIEDTTRLMMTHIDKPINAGSEHLFAWNLENTTGRHFIHGEIVALGILISSYLHGKKYEQLKQAMDKAQVLYHPDQLGVTWDEIKKTLCTIQEYNKNVRQFNTIFDEIDWTPKKLEEIRNLIFKKWQREATS